MINKILNYKCHPFIFGLYRISLGLTLLIYIALMSNRWIEFFGAYGTSPVKLRNEITFARPSLLSYLHTDAALWIFYALTVVMLIAFILGRLGKWPAIFLFVTMVSIQNSNANNVNAEEFILVVFAFYAMIMPINDALFFDFKKMHFVNSDVEVHAWTLFPFFIHIEIIYGLSLILKPLLEPAWVDGTLIYYSVNNFDMSRFPGWSIFKFHNAIISRIMTWASLLIEGAFPILVWVRPLKVPMILAMLSFQIGIAIMLSGVQFFSLSTCNALILFLPSAETSRFLRKVFSRRGVVPSQV